MKCQLCDGKYRKRLVPHTQYYRGELVVIDHVPALVCDKCGDTLYEPDTAERIEEIISSRKKPSRTIPVYEYSEALVGG